MKPALTVGITCFNEGELLREAFESVRGQSFQDWECLVINDASQDQKTNDICKALAKEPKVRVIRRDVNGGLSASRNTGVASAAADIYVPLDGDDLLPPTALEVICATFERNPDAGFVYGNYEAFGDWEYLCRPIDFSPRKLVEGCVFRGASPFRKSAWEAVGGFSQELSYGMQDWEFWISVIERGIPGVYVDSLIYRYRAREGTMCRRRGRRYPMIYEYIYKKHENFLRSQGVGREFVGKGYALGARCAYAEGDDSAARRLMWRALLFGDLSPSNIYLLARAFAPKAARRWLSSPGVRRQ